MMYSASSAITRRTVDTARRALATTSARRVGEGVKQVAHDAKEKTKQVVNDAKEAMTKDANPGKGKDPKESSFPGAGAPGTHSSPSGVVNQQYANHPLGGTKRG